MPIEKFLDNEFGDNERAIEQDKDRLAGGYGGDYFDENEHRAGQEKRDLATGNPIKNDEGVKTPHGLIITPDGVLKEQLQKELENDPATKWLLENGFDLEGNKIEKKEEDSQHGIAA